MNNQIIYELIQSIKKIGAKNPLSTITPVNSFLENLTDSSIGIENLMINDLPQDINYNTTKEFLDLVADPIIQHNTSQNRKSTLGTQYYRAFKLLFVAEILNNMLLKRSALWVAEVAAKKAVKFNFLNIAFLAFRIIYMIRRVKGDVKEENEAIDNFRSYLDYYKIEKGIEIENNNIQRILNRSNLLSQEISSRCNEIINEYKPYERIIPSFYFHFYFYTINHVKSSHDKNQNDIYENALNALNYFDELKFEYTPGKLTFTYVLIVYYLQRRQFEEGEKLLKKAYTYISSKSQHWFRIKENELLLMLHRGYFSRALQVFYEASSQSSFLSLANFDQERWRLYEAYINLILETGNAQFNERRKRFSVQKFINDQPRFSKDKRSMNIPILIAQMLFFIVRRRYNHAIDRIEALEKYTSRYLRNDDTFRSNCFIKMILEIPKNSFNQLRVERAAQKYFERLLDSEIELINQPFEIEIIPYERLWAMIMNHLRADHHYSPKRAKVA